ncbi:MAG: hypothetical protein EBR82_23020 [Caulobacteraceae bacterium]|nr:hypothetical protein [Caulobacteraceae bacterium]
MPIVQRIMGSGIPAQAAQNINGDWSGALTATGSSQATALLLGSVVNSVTTTAASTGVQLPATSPGDWVYVHNSGANTLSVYGQTGDAIQSGAANAAFSVAANKGALFFRVSTTLWGAILTA